MDFCLKIDSAGFNGQQDARLQLSDKRPIRISNLTMTMFPFWKLNSASDAFMRRKTMMPFLPYVRFLFLCQPASEESFAMTDKMAR
jgi:hypothetical protein